MSSPVIASSMAAFTARRVDAACTAWLVKRIKRWETVREQLIDDEMKRRRWFRLPASREEAERRLKQPTGLGFHPWTEMFAITFMGRLHVETLRDLARASRGLVWLTAEDAHLLKDHLQ